MQQRILFSVVAMTCVFATDATARAKEMVFKDPQQQGGCAQQEYTKPTTRTVINSGTNAAISPPVLSKDGNIFVGGAGTDFYEISADGKTQTKIPLSDLTSKSATFLDDGTAIIPCNDGKIFGYQNGKKFQFAQPGSLPRSVLASHNKAGKEIVAVATKSGDFLVYDNQGQLLCTYQSRGEKRKEDEVGFFSMTKDNNGNFIVGSTENRVYVLNDSCSEAVDPIPTAGDVFDAPAVDSEGNIRFGSYDGNVYTLGSDYNVKNKRPVGDTVNGKVVEYPASKTFPNGLFLFTTFKGQLYFVDKNGKDVIPPVDITGGDPIHSAPVVLPNGLIAVGGDDKKMHFVSTDGKVVSTIKADGEIRSDPLALEDGGIAFNTRHGNIYIVNGPQPVGNVGDVNKGCSTVQQTKVSENTQGKTGLTNTSGGTSGATAQVVVH